jgi:hypothetical protein
MVKLNFGGVHVWSKVYGGSGEQSAEAVAMDSAGNVLVTGHTNETFKIGSIQLTHKGNWDAFHAKFDSKGEPVWAFSVAGSSEDMGRGVAVNSTGDAFFTGWFHTMAYEGKTYYPYNRDMYLLKRSK